jgi:hypothetical protein
MTYKELFFLNFSNNRGNIKKGTKAIDVWNSIEEMVRLVLTPVKKVKKTKTK